MRELKTINDIKMSWHEEGVSYHKDLTPPTNGDKIVLVSTLKDKAIKWIKHYDEFDGEFPLGIMMWIVYFFDIKKGDLK